MQPAQLFREDLPWRESFADAFGDCISKPLVWVMGAGLVPAVLAGLWPGYQLDMHLPRP